ncbi:hypothetical protein R1sor_015714 [Riccia sorocarpa]|uniref:RRP15-like protein n=1 Tax=Riccia sorocarpa TaxID=122646 RepID=A0ABD3HH00_9MARC
MGKRKSEEELEAESGEEEDDDETDALSGDDDDDHCGGEESESGESDDEEDDEEDEGDEGDEDDEDGEDDEDDEDEEGASGSEIDGDEDEDDFEEGGSDVDELIQDDEFEGVSGSDVSDGQIEGADDAEENGEESHRRGGKVDGIGSAFGRAFSSIMNKKVPKSELTESLGPVLAERKQLLVKKLEEEENERKKKTDVKRKKREEKERGHVIPQTYTDAKEKALIKLATTGVVRLFNAVSKAQKVQADADISSSRAAKATWKQSKQVFMSQLRAGSREEKVPIGGPEMTEEEPGWAALKDDFMLGSAKMKDWDKNPEDVAA